MKLPALRVYGLVAAISGALVGCGDEPGSSRPAAGVGAAAAALKGASPAPEASQILAVVNFAGGQCSGSPITPDLVLTARHCIGRTSEISSRVVCSETLFTDPDSAGAMFVLTTPTITDQVEDYHHVRAVRMLPGEDAHVCGHDVALLRLREPLGVTPLIPRVDVPPEAGEPYTAYGYGDDEADLGPGVRRTLGGLEVTCVGRRCPDREVFETEWNGSDGVCAGDSGGPALDASGRILGVVSRGYPGCESPIYESVPSFADFLKSEALLAAEEGAYEPPAWALGHSTEPRFYFEVGAPCDAPSECPSGLCGADHLCTRQCASDGPCPSGYHCDDAVGTCTHDESAPGSAGTSGDAELPEKSHEPASSCALRATRNTVSGRGAGLLLGVILMGLARRAKEAQRAPVGS